MFCDVRIVAVVAVPDVAAAVVAVAVVVAAPVAAVVVVARIVEVVAVVVAVAVERVVVAAAAAAMQEDNSGKLRLDYSSLQRKKKKNTLKIYLRFRNLYQMFYRSNIQDQYLINIGCVIVP